MNILKIYFNTAINLATNFTTLLMLIIALGGLRVILYIIEPKIKGYIGEQRVKRQLEKLPKNKYIILNDILIRDGKMTVQIDHIVLSQHGIFVIETKHYKGWIHGHENSKYWKQTIFRYKKPFYNPIKQNYNHIQSLIKLLPNCNLPFYSIIIFSGSAKLKNVHSTTPVIYDYELKRHIQSYEHSCSESVLFQTIENLALEIKKHNIEDPRVRKQHIRNVKNRNNLKKDIVPATKEVLKCPKCNGNLVKKNGKYGEFLSCSNYPKCKYTQNLNKNQKYFSN